MCGYTTTGYFNPAVTFAIFLRKKISFLVTMQYIVAQIIGAALASLAYFTITNTTFLPKPGPNGTFYSTILIEILFTLALALTVLHATNSKNSKTNPFYGLTIGMMLTAGIFTGSGISGAVYNPALALGAAIIDTHIGSYLTFLLIYITAPLIGSALASLIFRLTDRDDE
jgi:aquaporin Z